MKYLGIVIVALGILGLVFAFSMDTTIETGGETIGSGIYSVTIPIVRVHNLGLMEQRRNVLYTSGLAILVGIILYGFGSIQQNLIGPKDEAKSSSITDVTTEQSVILDPASVQHLVGILCPKCSNAESVPESESRKRGRSEFCVS